MTATDDVQEELMEKGRVREKQQVLARLLENRFLLSEIENNIIFVISDPVKLDRALDEVKSAKTKERVISLLL